MKLQPGYRLAIPPLFHFPIQWAERLFVGSGVEEEDGCFFPRPSWRSISPEELALLIHEELPENPPPIPNDYLFLIQLPQHLLTRWWEILEQAEEFPTGHIPGFDGFVSEISSFLKFKNLSVPAEAVFDLVAGQPGQKSIRWDSETNRYTGLAFDLPPETPWPAQSETTTSWLWSGINLGAEPMDLVWINLLPQQMNEQLSEHQPEYPTPSCFGELGNRFLLVCSDYPVIRLKIEPGEGFRLPATGLLIDGWTQNSQEPTLMLLIRKSEKG